MFAGAFLAATIIPFSSDILLIGILLAGGDPWISFLSATAGNWLGGLTSYGLGRIGKWEKLLKQKSKIDKYGSWIALITWLPFVGDVFAIGLGFYKLNFAKCAVFMLIGKGARFAVWILLFYLKTRL